MKPSEAMQIWHNPPNNMTSYFGAHLVKHIVYRLSEEQQQTTAYFHMEEVLVCVDLLAVICEHYDEPLGLPVEDVIGWRERYVKVFEMGYQFTVSDIGAQEKTIQERYDILIKAFDRLEAIARKHPAGFGLPGIGKF